MDAKIRNAYQKIRVGDTIGWRNMGQIQTGKVTSKQPLGFLAVLMDEEDKAVASSDVVFIERPGVGRINLAMRQRCKIISSSAFRDQIGDATPVTWGNDASVPSGFMVTVECAAIGGAKALKPVFFFSREVEALD